MVDNRSVGAGDPQRFVSFIPEPPPVTGDAETLRSWASRQFRQLSLQLDIAQREFGDQSAALAGLAALASHNASLIAAQDVRLASAEADIAAQDARLASAEADIAAQDVRLTSAEADIAAQDVRLTSAEADIADLDVRLAAAEADIAAQDARLATVEADEWNR